MNVAERRSTRTFIPFAAVLLIVGLLAALGSSRVLGRYHLSRGGEALQQATASRGEQDEWACLATPIEDASGLAAAESAISHLQAALRHDSHLDQAYLLLGRAYCLQGNYPAAIDAYQAYTRLRPRNPLARLELGFAWEASGDPSEAARQWKAAGLSPDEFMLKGFEAYRAGQWETSRRWYQRASHMGADLESCLLYLEYLSIGDPNRVAAHEALEKAIRADHGWGADEFRFQAWYHWGRELAERSDFAAAIAALQKAVAAYPGIPSLQPTLAEAYRLMGSVEWGRGNLAAASQSYQTAIELDPANAWVHIHYGKVLYLQDPLQVEETTNQFALALAIQPDKIELWLNLIDFWLWQQETQQAYQLCQQALARWGSEAQLSTRCSR